MVCSYNMIVCLKDDQCSCLWIEKWVSPIKTSQTTCWSRDVKGESSIIGKCSAAKLRHRHSNGFHRHSDRRLSSAGSWVSEYKIWLSDYTVLAECGNMYIKEIYQDSYESFKTYKFEKWRFDWSKERPKPGQWGLDQAYLVKNRAHS